MHMVSLSYILSKFYYGACALLLRVENLFLESVHFLRDLSTDNN